MENIVTRVSAREANQEFSKLLRRVVAGEEVVITRRGVPVARLAPISAGAKRARKARIARMITALQRGLPLGGRRATRAEMHQ